MGMNVNIIGTDLNFKKRGNIHVHGVVKLKSDPGLSNLSRQVIKGRKAAQIFRIAKSFSPSSLSINFPTDEDILPSLGDTFLPSLEAELRRKLEKKMLDEDEIHQLTKDIENGKTAERILCRYRDNIVSTWHPKPPHDATREERDQQNLPSFGKHACCNIHSKPDGSIGLKTEEYINIIDQCQRHRHHTTYCLRNGKCRFSFPKPIQTETRIVVKEIPYKRNMHMLRKTSVEFAFECNDRWINSHNPVGLLAWGGNMDCALLIDPYAVLEYVCKYCTKSETSSSGLTHMLNAAIKKRQDQGELETSKVLRTLFNLQLRRDKCTQEIAHLAASRPIVHSSHQFLDINLTSQIRKLNVECEEQDVPVILDNVYDLYLKRFIHTSWVIPDDMPSLSVLNDMSLSNFVIDYTRTLRNNRYKIIRRSNNYNIVPIFTPEFSSNPNSDTYWCYCYLSLLKYKPHAETFMFFESKTASDHIETCEISAQEKEEIISTWISFLSDCKNIDSLPDKVVREYHALRREMDEIDPICMSISSNYSIDNEHETSGALNKLINVVDDEEIIPWDEKRDWTFPSNQYAQSEFNTTFIEATITHAVNFVNNSLPSNNKEFIDTSLCNQEQKETLSVWKQICINSKSNNIATSQSIDNAMIINGLAGTGKSFLIKSMIQTFQSIDGNAEKQVLVLAPTGKAAVAAGGFTLHSSHGLLLPIDPKRKASYTPLSSKQLLVLQSRFEFIKALIIDEYSMIGLVELFYIDRRLKQILCSQLPFGGIPIAFVGDPGQLPPVAASSLWTMKDAKGRAFQSILRRQGSEIYRNISNVMQLTQVVRQSDEHELEFLLAVRDGKIEDKHWSWINSKCSLQAIKNRGDLDRFLSSACIHVYSTNEEVRQHNRKMIMQNKQPINKISARHDSPESASVCSDFTENLPKQLYLSIGSSVMILKNLHSNWGVVNGSTGLVKDFLYSDDVSFPNYIVVEIDDYCGPPIFSLPHQRKWFPIPRRIYKWGLDSRNYRESFPLTLAYAITIWKSQRMTISCPLYFSLGNKEPEHGASYVLFSRITSFQNLCIGSGIEKERLTTAISSGKKLKERLHEDKRLSYLYLNTKLNFGIINQAEYILYKERLDSFQSPPLLNTTSIINKQKTCRIVAPTTTKKKTLAIQRNRVEKPNTNNEGSCSSLSSFMSTRAISFEEANTYLLSSRPIIISRGSDFQVTVTHDSLHRLRWDRSLTAQQKWLNDDVVNGCTQVFHNMLRQLNQRSTVIFSTHFFSRLMDEGDSNEFKYQNVERWSRRMASVGLDIFQADTLLFPINQMNNHWVLVVAYISQKKIVYYDSCLGNGYACYCGIIYECLVQEYSRINRNDVMIGWDVPIISSNNCNIPSQGKRDYFSCGCFVLAYIECIAFNLAMDFTSEEMMVEYRKYLISLLHKTLSITSCLSDVEQGGK